VDAKEVASLVGDWGIEVSGSSGSSLGALWELITVAHIAITFSFAVTPYHSLPTH